MARTAGNEGKPPASQQLAHAVIDVQPLEDPDNFDFATQAQDQLWLVSGIPLPSKGRLYVLDQFAGKPELVRLTFDHMVGSHAEIQGSAAIVRLHETSPTFFVRRSLWMSDDVSGSSQSASAQSSFCLVRLRVKADHRVAATSASIVDTVVKAVPGGDWFEIQPKEPLAPGEYGWMSVSNGQDMVKTKVYGFAVDMAAPENAGALTTRAETSLSDQN
jgi:hypothetical protein